LEYARLIISNGYTERRRLSLERLRDQMKRTNN
jgi:hypothetical protein